MHTCIDHDTPTYPENVPAPATPGAARALIYDMVEAMSDDAAEALCFFLAWWSWPGQRREEG